MKQYKSKIWGIVAALLALLILFLLLWFVYLDSPYVPEEEGIEVALGDYVDGGAEQFTPAESVPEVVAPAPAPAAPSANDLVVQEDEESLALQKKAEEERKRLAAEEALREKQRQEELARIEAERLAKEKAAAEKAAREQAARDKAKSLMSGAFGNNSNSTSGSGSTTGNTTQGDVKGNPASSGSGNGPQVSLAGRNLRGKLTTPKYDTNDEGIVVVSIRVNAAGKVVEAKKWQGTNTSNEALISAAVNAAKLATFSETAEGSPDVFGTITYNFTNR